VAQCAHDVAARRTRRLQRGTREMSGQASVHGFGERNRGSCCAGQSALKAAASVPAREGWKLGSGFRAAAALTSRAQQRSASDMQCRLHANRDGRKSIVTLARGGGRRLIEPFATALRASALLRRAPCTRGDPARFTIETFEKTSLVNQWKRIVP
jgi:hypothetical protein